MVFPDMRYIALYMRGFFLKPEPAAIYKRIIDGSEWDDIMMRFECVYYDDTWDNINVKCSGILDINPDEIIIKDDVVYFDNDDSITPYIWTISTDLTDDKAVADLGTFNDNYIMKIIPKDVAVMYVL